MEQLTKLIDFLASYPAWVKYVVIGLILAITLLLVFFRPPRPAGLTHWKLRVYYFDNLGEKVKKNHVGERFSGRILDDLVRRQLDAKQGTEQRSFTNIFLLRGGPPEDALEAYRKLAPFVEVSGYIDEEINGGFNANVRVNRVDVDLSFSPLLDKTYKLSPDESNWEATTQSIGEEVFGLISTMPR